MKNKKGRPVFYGRALVATIWSGREDSNLRPPAPHADALARLRYVPNTTTYFSVFLKKVKMPAACLSLSDAVPAPRFRRKAACRQLSLAGDMMVCYSTAVLHEGPDPILKEGRPMSKFLAARQGFT